MAYAHCKAERWSQPAELFVLAGSQAYEYPWYFDGDPAREFAAAHRQASAHGRR